MCFQTHPVQFERQIPLLPGYRLLQVRECFILTEKTNNLKVIVEYTLVLLERIDLSHKMLRIQVPVKN